MFLVYLWEHTKMRMSPVSRFILWRLQRLRVSAFLLYFFVPFFVRSIYTAHNYWCIQLRIDEKDDSKADHQKEE